MIIPELNECSLCPRKCRVNRNITKGYCGVGNDVVLAKASLHKWEEPCISWKNGAGTIFFSGCSLHCCYCQNNHISNEVFGKTVSIEHLSQIFLSLQEIGADNIELVTPTHYVPQIIRALDSVKHKLFIPIIYNSGGYEFDETIDMLNGYIDIYMPDIKYFSSEVSKKYSNAVDYFERSSSSILKMIKQVGKLEYNSQGGLLKGTVIRHLVLPFQRHDSMRILDWIHENTTNEYAILSLMSQYTPFDFISDKYPELKRHITKMEYHSVEAYAAKLGINGYCQQMSSASEQYLPEFDLSGLE